MNPIVFLCAYCIAFTLARPTILSPTAIYTTATIPISSQFHSQDSLGRYSYGYNGGPSAKNEIRTLDGITRGSYSYIDADGKLQTVQYTADAINGFRAAASNLPKAPVDNKDLPEQVSETPEVAKARAEHLAAYREAEIRAEKYPEEPTFENDNGDSDLSGNGNGNGNGNANGNGNGNGNGNRNGNGNGNGNNEGNSRGNGIGNGNGIFETAHRLTTGEIIAIDSLPTAIRTHHPTIALQTIGIEPTSSFAYRVDTASPVHYDIIAPGSAATTSTTTTLLPNRHLAGASYALTSPLIEPLLATEHGATTRLIATGHGIGSNLLH